MSKASYQCTQEDTDLITNIFLAMDKNGDKRISREELKEGLKKFGVQGLTDHEAEALFRELDVNPDGYLYFEELLVFMALLALAHPQIDKRAKLCRAFNAMDKNKDGILSKDELEVGLKQAGVDLNNDEFLQLFLQLDENGDGRINFEEFIALCE